MLGQNVPILKLVCLYKHKFVGLVFKTKKTKINKKFLPLKALDLLTLDIIIPAILIRILGPFNNLYLMSTPFQKDTKYLLI